MNKIHETLKLSEAFKAISMDLALTIREVANSRNRFNETEIAEINKNIEEGQIAGNRADIALQDAQVVQLRETIKQ